jgi:hypothetical protein
MEPVVRDIDFDTATFAELNEMSGQLDERTAEFEATLERDCPNVGGEGAQQALLDLARSEAPGTVAYLEFTFAMLAQAGGEGSPVSGDCDTDIAAVEAIVDGGGTVADLTMAEVNRLTSLMTAIGRECPLEKATEFFERAEIEAFMADLNGG